MDYAALTDSFRWSSKSRFNAVRRSASRLDGSQVIQVLDERASLLAEKLVPGGEAVQEVGCTQSAEGLGVALRRAALGVDLQ